MLKRMLLVLGSGAIACATGRLSVDPVAISVARPSQVALYVAVSEGNQPLTDLGAGSFTLYEDGNRLDSSQVKLTLLDRDRAAAHRTLILVDASAKLGDREKPLERGVASMVRTVFARQPVSVYAFSGSGKIKQLSAIEPGGNVDDDPLGELDAGGGDVSRDLNGAILQALDRLEADLAGSEKPVRIGTLVVIASGPDLAGRVAPEQLNARLNATHHSVLAVGIGDKPGGLERIGKDGVWYTATADEVSEALGQVATKIDGLYKSRYLLAYCSPARAGERRLRVEVSKTDPQGRPVASHFETRFDAGGFGPGCDPAATPPFVVALVAANGAWVPAAVPEAAPVEPETETDDGDASGEKEAEKSADPAARGQAAKPRPPARAAPAPRPGPKSRPAPAPRPAAAPEPPPAKPKPPPPSEPPQEFEP